MFRVMMPEERLEWIQRFAEWRDREYAVLCGVGEYWSSEHAAMMERGLDLLMAWPFARDFVEKTRMFRDYARRMARVQFYMELISKELTALSLPLDVPASSAPRRRGRPTKEESAQMERERAERGVAQALIEPHSLAAVDANRAVRAIYNDVDSELANIYAVLSVEGDHLAAWEQRCTAQGITIAQLQAVVKPYWEKVGCPSAQKVVSPAEEENRHERAAKMHRIRTYFMRKDRKVTAQRVETMRKYIKELRDMGVATEEYEVILKATEEALKLKIEN